MNHNKNSGGELRYFCFRTTELSLNDIIWLVKVI
jgi:hypothetical protein